MHRPNPTSLEEQQKVERLEETMVALNVIKLRLVYALDVLKTLGDDYSKAPAIDDLLQKTLRLTMDAKKEAYDELKKLAYDKKASN